MTLYISRTIGVTVRIEGGKMPYSCKFYVDDTLPRIINNINSNSFSEKVNWGAYCDDPVDILVECTDSTNHTVSDSTTFWVTNGCD